MSIRNRVTTSAGAGRTSRPLRVAVAGAASLLLIAGCANAGRGSESSPAAPTAGPAASGATSTPSGAAGSGGSATGEPSGSAAPVPAKGDTLTIALQAPATGLNPASVNTAFWTYAILAYEPLVYRGPDGELQPALAQEWKVTDGNTKVDLTIRKGVTFSDGEAVTPDAVKKSLEYCASDKSVNAASLKDVSKIEVSGDHVVLTLSEADPTIEQALTQTTGCGMIISPKGVDAAADLTVDTTSAGAGAYVYQPGDSVAGDHYTYTANPTYWDPSKQHYQKVVLRVIADPQATINALKTGQVDFAAGDVSTAAQAKSANLQIAFTPFVWSGLNLIDRNGTLTKAMGDVRVRQAINYAIDRKTLAAAVGGGYFTPSSQVSAEGFDGYVPALDDRYPYDIAKAKQLLTEAGYPDGVDIPVLSVKFGSFQTVSTALTQMLAPAGIRLKVTMTTDEKGYFTGMTNQQYSAVTVGYGSQPMYQMASALVKPDGGVFNGFKTDDPKALALLKTLQTSSGDAAAPAAQALETYLVEQAWFAPIAFGPVLFYGRSGLGGIQVSGKAPTISPLDLYNQG